MTTKIKSSYWLRWTMSANPKPTETMPFGVIVDHNVMIQIILEEFSNNKTSPLCFSLTSRKPLSLTKIISLRNVRVYLRSINCRGYSTRRFLPLLCQERTKRLLAAGSKIWQPMRVHERYTARINAKECTDYIHIIKHLSSHLGCLASCLVSHKIMLVTTSIV